MQVAMAAALAMMCGVQDVEEQRVRIRALGVSPGVMSPGEHNAITDVTGVRVGHVTIIEGDDVRTGVTAIVPGEDVFQQKVPAAVWVQPVPFAWVFPRAERWSRRPSPISRTCPWPPPAGPASPP